MALLRCGQHALRTGKVREIRLVLRLFDEHVARATSDFEASWRAFLHAWNLFQFHDDIEMLSSEMLPATRPVSPETALPIAAERKPPPYPEPDESLREILELATQQSHAVILAVQKAGLPLPQLDFQLSPRTDRCSPEADLAWPDAQVAILADRQLQDRSDFEVAEWKVYEYPVEPSNVTATIKLRLEGAGSGARQ